MQIHRRLVGRGSAHEAGAQTHPHACAGARGPGGDSQVEAPRRSAVSTPAATRTSSAGAGLREAGGAAGGDGSPSRDALLQMSARDTVPSAPPSLQAWAEALPACGASCWG